MPAARFVWWWLFWLIFFWLLWLWLLRGESKVPPYFIGFAQKLVNGLNSFLFNFSFSREPYIDLVHSRNQRSFLSWLRISAHSLEIKMYLLHLDFVNFVLREKLAMGGIFCWIVIFLISKGLVSIEKSSPISQKCQVWKSWNQCYLQNISCCKNYQQVHTNHVSCKR